MFSIIIPTKDEEKYIGNLLESIDSQTIQPDEIVIADKSQDNTASIAKSFGAKVVQGTDDHRVGKARNNGARHTYSDYLIFLDGDCELRDDDFFEKLLEKFTEKDLDIATCYFTPDKKNLKSIIAFTSFNALKTWGHMTKKVIAEGAACMVIKREVFLKLGGFDEKLTIGEDAEIVKRAIDEGYKFAVIPLLIQTSSRRFKGRSIIAAAVGAAGITYATMYGIKWLKKHTNIFHKLYWGKDPKKASKNTDEDAKNSKKGSKNSSKEAQNSAKDPKNDDLKSD
jgi:glycosyltransferase involved in cell wall biosynthesis